MSGADGSGALHSCIISLATQDKPFPEKLRRLEQNVIESGFKGKLHCWHPGRYPKGCPDHRDVPFAFKPYCFHEACSCGMDFVLWLDSSSIVVRSLKPIFRAIENNGYFFFRNGQNMVGHWASDEALAECSLNRSQALLIPEISGGVIGLNLKNATARVFLEQWLGLAERKVAFRGSRQPLRTLKDHADMKWNRNKKASSQPGVLGHRHDQTAASIIAHQLGMKLTSKGVQSYSASHRWIHPGTMIVIDRTPRHEKADPHLIERIRRDRYTGVFAQTVNVVRRLWG